jgi:hypothetical protein
VLARWPIHLPRSHLFFFSPISFITIVVFLVSKNAKAAKNCRTPNGFTRYATFFAFRTGG